MSTIPSKTKSRGLAAQAVPPVEAPVTRPPIAGSVPAIGEVAIEKAAEAGQEATALAEDLGERGGRAAEDAIAELAAEAGAATDRIVGEAEGKTRAAADGIAGLVDVNKALFEAFVASGTVVAAGAREISQSLLALTLSSWQDQLTAGQALAGAKNIGEAVELAGNLARGQFEKLVSEGFRIGGLSGKIAQDALSPISGQVGAVMQKYRSAA